MKWNSRTDDTGQEGDGPILGEGFSQGDIKATHPHAQAGASPPSLALHSPMPLISGFTDP